MQLTVDKDLALGNVASKIGNGMGDICIDAVRWAWGVERHEVLPSLGIVRIGICVIEPLRPCTRPARS